MFSYLGLGCRRFENTIPAGSLGVAQRVLVSLASPPELILDTQFCRATLHDGVSFSDMMTQYTSTERIKGNFAFTLCLLALTCVNRFAGATPVASNLTEILSFPVPKPPTGLFFDSEDSRLLYVLCGGEAHKHYMYVYSTSGKGKCFVEFLLSTPMSKLDGFFIDHQREMAYLVDSQGPQDDSSMGGSVYEVKWNDPCECSGGGGCRVDGEQKVVWLLKVTNQWTLDAQNVSNEEGGGVDEFFRNSGIVVVGDSWIGVNGVDPTPGNNRTASYPKSIIQYNMTESSLTDRWSFDGSEVGRDVGMEGLSCGPDKCANSLFVGDEANYIYQLDLDSGEVSHEWDLNSVVGNLDTNKGIGALTYADTTGYFYAGVRETSTIHVVRLEGATEDASAVVLRSLPILSLAILVGLVITMG